MLHEIVDLAHRAGALIRAGLERERSFAPKQHADVVTDIDQASEALIVGAIRERYPDHVIIAEEGGVGAESGAYSWYIDPLDGTLNYLHGFPFCSVSIAVAHHGQLLAGVVYDPLRNELFSAEHGRGAQLNGRVLRPSTTVELRAALLTTGFPYDRFSQPDNNLREFGHLLLRVQDIRRPGSAALDLCYVAAGRSDAHWELGLSPWDTAAGALILQESGGTISDWDGHPWRLGDPRIVGSNGRIHAELLQELAYVRSTGG
jgi:myo-inositol-1(or 4)-monophosphatase